MGRAQAQQEEVLFRSRGRGFRAVMQASFDEPTNFGIKRHKGRVIEFAPSGEYRTSDPEEIAHLRGLGTLNLEFWEVGKEPDRIPSPEPVIDRILAATLELDLATLETIEHEERGGYGREQVLSAVRSARRQVTDAQVPAGSPLPVEEGA